MVLFFISSFKFESKFTPKIPSSLLPNEYTICSSDKIKLCSFPQEADIAFIFLFILEIFIGSLIFSFPSIFG